MTKKLLYLCLFLLSLPFVARTQSFIELKNNFISPPDDARPGVYWYFMDGNLDKKGITGDLESMKKVGIGSVLFLEVNIGVPRGKVDLLSSEWQELFSFIISECRRLGITMTLGIGPGWTGSGGPWVKPEESMRHLVCSSVEVKGGSMQTIKLPRPVPHSPYFGEGNFTPELKKEWEGYYKDVYVLAFPAPDSGAKIADIDEKALFIRHPYTSRPGTVPFMNEPFLLKEANPGQCINMEKIVDLTNQLQSDGTIKWKVSAGKWTIMRFGMTNNGALTRPAPMPGLGFECDKFDTAALQRHFDAFVGKLIKQTGSETRKGTGGLATLHMDSWEMGAQNWGDHFREEFMRLRGYDPKPYLPVYKGMIVGSVELSERFLWDVRKTAQDLVLQNHAEYVKKLAHQYGLSLSIEPYDMNPTADLDLGAVSDEPGCEFWNYRRGFASAFSCIEAASIAHVMGRPVVMAESFTSDWNKDPYDCYPTSLKNQGDWAFCAGVNRFYYHTFAHKSWLGDDRLPGMSMGGYGVHWDRGQTWWNMSGEYHKYITRCSYMLRQGRTVADILYLTPEGAPHVFRAPASALDGHPDSIPDHKGFNFDGCSPEMLMKYAEVKDGNIVFPGGASYKILVLPSHKTMTPDLIRKLELLINAGAVIMGNPPKQSPSLKNYPACDNEIRTIANTIWGSEKVPASPVVKSFGKGKIYWGGEYSQAENNSIYPTYSATAKILKELGASEDFSSDARVRYAHRRTADKDIWFVSNKTKEKFVANCSFSNDKGSIEIWNPVTGEMFASSHFKVENGHTNIPIRFEADQSYFVIFDKNGKSANTSKDKAVSIASLSIQGPWEVTFDPKWGGPGKVVFKTLEDWTKRPEEGIKYYSGTAVYKTTFDFKSSDVKNLVLNLGEVNNMARVRLNGQDLGVVWTAPWQINISGAIKKGSNVLEIEVVNLWPNRIIGDEKLPYDGVKDDKWPSWLLNGSASPTGRHTFTIWKLYNEDSPLLKSGLIGPVTIVGDEKNIW